MVSSDKTKLSSRTKQIAIFASGGGSNALKIIQYFKDNKDVNISLILSNNANAPVLKKAVMHGINSIVFGRQEFYESDKITKKLIDYSIDLVVLAGFLWLVPDHLLNSFENKIINIHPALLPKYGGKGMFGHHVHEAVKAAGEEESGITIHYVNKEYDKGEIIFQARCKLSPDDNPKMIAQKVLALEHQHFAKTVDRVINNKINNIK